MDKLGRNYSLAITTSGVGSTAPIVVSLPFTIEFDITRNTLTSANVCQIRLYNLSPSNRNTLRRSVTSGWSNPLIDVVLRAGYGTNLPVIFSGNVSEAWSVREGINFITQMECYDGGFSFVNAQTNLTVPKGTPYKIVITNLIESMAPDVTLGVVGDYPGSTPKDITLSGSTIYLLNQLTGGGFFINNGIGNALRNDEYSVKNGPPVTINASAGLLNLPIVQNNIVRFDMVFEPLLNIGTAVNLKSSIHESFNKNFNGFYSVTSVKHRGMISETVCGDVITTGEFFFLQTPQAVA